MTLFRFSLYLGLGILVLGCKETSTEGPGLSGNVTVPVFVSQHPEATGVDFINQVDEGNEFNVLTYRNFYNGGGVAIGDVNDDGMPDLFFTANMQSNKLYLNRGDWQFEDVTEISGTSGNQGWSTGVSMADINGDGWLDIYVCHSGDIAGDNKKNELFIHSGRLDAMGIPQFTEQAAAFDLDDEGFSTHASFFDYDLDGDLDCYILNNSFKDPEKIDLYISTRTDHDELGGDKLMRNDGDRFTDVTVDAGIYNSMIGFGLGVSVSDLNGDMLPDIYISNDFWERDYLYINLGDGTFSEELTDRIGLCSVSSMGSDIADLNNDGACEIFTTDMLAADNYRLKAMTVFDPYHLEDLKYRSSFHYQILQNSLQLNDGSANFQEIAHYAGVAATDWSWGALIFDFDNDGWKDIFVSNGIYKDIMYLDFTNFLNDEEEVRKIVEEKGSFDWRDFSEYMPSNPLSNFGFLNNADLTFDNSSSELGLGDPQFSNGSSYGDLDQDGDLDLVVNNLNMPAVLYRNMSQEQNGTNFLAVDLKGNGKNVFGVGAEVRIETGDQVQVQQHFLSRGFQSSVAPGLVFGLGDETEVDRLTVIWPDKRMQTLSVVVANQKITLDHGDADQFYEPVNNESAPLFYDATGEVVMGNYFHTENRYNDFDHEPLLPRMLSTEGPDIVVGDVDGNGLEDILLLGAADDPDKLFVQEVDGTFKPSQMAVFEKDKALESTCGAFFDADGDGDQDLLVGAGGNEYQKGVENFLLRYYENDGKGRFERALQKTPPAAGDFSCILPKDLDKDGDIDLFIGGRCVPGNYGLPPRSFLLRNDGNNQWTDIIPQDRGSFGMVTDGVWSDTDGDGLDDLIIVGEWMPIIVFRNDGRGISQPEIIRGSLGWWNAIEACDLDQDGDQDFVVGNWGLNTKFKASTSRPLTMYVKDFDNNQKTEFIINWYAPLDDQAYPFASKMELVEQLPQLKKSILKFEDYANKTYQNLFTAEEQAGALTYAVDNLQSSIVWNEEGTFRLEALPWQAQLSPTFAILAEDLNGDQTPDIWLGGNFYGLKPQVGRHDAGRGTLLLGNGNGQFDLVTSNSGIDGRGEVRDAKIIDIQGRLNIIVARNNDAALIFTQ
ncbi:MAG: VCBS repeat-containing protein [Saprospiraceae bacterium]|nr:VCBS repeat-containing protein [Saprospiraceae bacterium]